MTDTNTGLMWIQFTADVNDDGVINDEDRISWEDGLPTHNPKPGGKKEMLKVDQYDYIRTAHRAYGKSIKQIARDTGHSKNTTFDHFQRPHPDVR